MIAADLMSSPFPTVPRDTSVMVALRVLFAVPGATLLPVVEDGEVLGVVQAVDLAFTLDGPLQRLMRPIPTSVSPSAHRSEITRAYSLSGFHDVLVMQDGRLLGVVTAQALLRSMLADVHCESGLRNRAVDRTDPGPAPTPSVQPATTAHAPLGDQQPSSVHPHIGPTSPPGTVPTAQNARVLQPRPMDEHSHPPGPPRRTVLVVDDDEMMRQLEVMIVQDAGLLTLEAASAAEARAHLHENAESIGLVLLDVHLPDGSGVQLCEAITGGTWPAARSVPIVIVTADTEEAIVEDAFFAGSVRQFHKPFEPDELQAVVCAHLQSA